MNLRTIAAKIINAVTDGKSLADCLEPALISIPDPRDRALVQAMCYGVCRFYDRLDILLSYLLKKPMAAKDSDINALLLVGLYQLTEMRVPEHAAVSETVNAVADFKKPWARGLVNAVLREYLRHKTQLKEKLDSEEEALYSHPQWWISTIQKAWPEHWQSVLTANNTHPPMSLRVNLSKLSREKYLEKLQTHAMAADIIVETPSGINLETPVPVEKIPGFDVNEVRVQDGASQLAAGLLNLQPGQRVLDACAAPGGKLAHLLETEPNLAEVIAIDKDRERLAMLPQDSRIQALCADAANPKTWWDGKPFDRILLDAPCSASGTVRRHPDIKLLRQREDLPKLAKEQLRLLQALWPLLADGGVLVYATCSLFPQENVEVVETFLKSQADAKELKLDVKWGLPQNVGRQILPGMHGMDGFYYARVMKKK